MTATIQLEDDLYLCGEEWTRDVRPGDCLIFEFDGEAICGDVVGSDHNYDPPRHFVYTGREMNDERKACETCRWWTADPECLEMGDCRYALLPDFEGMPRMWACGPEPGLVTYCDFSCQAWEPKS